MVIIVSLLAIAMLAFLGKVGFVFYQAISMDFDFHRPWPTEDLSETDSTEEPQISSTLATEEVPLEKLILAK